MRQPWRGLGEVIAAVVVNAAAETLLVMILIASIVRHKCGVSHQLRVIARFTN